MKIITRNNVYRLFVAFGVLTGLYFLSQKNFLLFHGIAEGFSIVVALTIFFLVWNSRKTIGNSFFLVLGVAYLFVGSLDFLHTLAYKGMGVFPGIDSNPATQLWISARYLESFSLLAGLLLITRKIKLHFVIPAYMVVFTLLLLSIFIWEIFPVSFIEGVGLTPFKIISEYIISGILVIALFILWRYKTIFDRNIFSLLFASIILTILTELTFTLYTDVYGISNVIGHFLKIISFYLIYVAIIETGINKPLTVLFQNLKTSEEKYRSLFNQSSEGIYVHDFEGWIIDANEVACAQSGYSRAELLQLNIFDLYPDSGNNDNLPGDEILHPWNQWQPGEIFLYEGEHQRKDGTVYATEVSAGVIEYEEKTALIAIVKDITERKTAEDKITHLLRVLAAIRNVNQLIVREKNPGALIRQVVKLMTETHGFRSAVIILVDQAGAVNDYAEGGFGSRFNPLAEQLKQGILPGCCEKARLNSSVYLNTTNEEICTDCSIAGFYPDCNRLCHIIRYQNLFFGYLIISSKSPAISEVEEMELLGEISGDIAFGLYNIQQEHSLQESESKFSTIFQASPVSISVLRIRDGKFINVNDSYVQSTGFSREELLEANANDLNMWGSEEDYQDFFFRVQRRETISNKEFIFRNKRGELRTWLASFDYVDISGESCILFVGTDITERKLMEESLIASELFNSSLLEHSPNPIAVYNPDTSVQYVNPAFEKLTGYSSGELVGQKAPYPFWTDKTDKGLEGLKQNLQHGVTGNVMHLVNKNGKRFCVSINNTPVRINGEIAYTVANWVDITEEKAITEALQQSEERFRTMVNSLEEIVFTLDTEMRHTGVFGPWVTRTGFTPEYFLGKTVREIFGEETATVHEEANSRALAGEFVIYDWEVPGELVPRYYQTSLSPIRNHSGLVIGVVGIGRNITERNNMEEELRQSESRIRTTVDSMPQGLMVTDMDGLIIQVNKLALELYGCEFEENLIGKNGLDFAVKEDHEVIVKEIRNATNEGKKTNFRYTAVKKNGDKFAAEMSISSIKDSTGSTIGIVGIFEDITEQLKMQEQLIVTDRLASIGELAAGIAHEINNPLTGVVGFSDLLMERNDLPEDAMEDISIINKEAVRASQVARNLLTFSRQHPDDKRPVQINDVINLVLRLRAYEQKVNNIEVVTHLDDNLPEVPANDYQMQQIFINIIINAEFFMKEAHGRGRLEITTKRKEDKVRISITDNGPGITPEHLTRIFDPFYTTKDVGQGTGLGLSIVHGIVSEHGGSILAESEIGTGTAFIIELPVSEKLEE